MSRVRRWGRVAAAVTALAATGSAVPVTIATAAATRPATTVVPVPPSLSPPLLLRVDHARLVAGRRITLHFTVTSVGTRMPGATITIAGHRLKTDLHGRAMVTLRPVRPTALEAFAYYPGSEPTVIVLIVSGDPA